MNMPPERPPTSSPRDCSTCVPMLAAEAAVKRVDAQRDNLLHQEETLIQRELQDSSNLFVYLFRKWSGRRGALRLNAPLLENDRQRIESYGALKRRRELCSGPVCDANGENYRCGFDRIRDAEASDTQST